MSKHLKLVWKSHDKGHWSTGFIRKCRKSRERQAGGRSRKILNALPDLFLLSRAWDPLQVLEKGALNMEDDPGWGLDKGQSEKTLREENPKGGYLCCVDGRQ